MREGAWGLLLGVWLCACGAGDGSALPVDSAGPWSQEAVLDYSKQFAVGMPQSVGLDEGGNLWLLDGARVGVLRPGDSQPTRPFARARFPGVSVRARASRRKCSARTNLPTARPGYSCRQGRRVDSRTRSS